MRLIQVGSVPSRRRAYNQTVIATAAVTLYGYIAFWDTTSVANGVYSLQSLATDRSGNITCSDGITIRVSN